MIDEFIHTIDRQFPMLREGKHLLAYSGGVDSTVLGELLRRAGIVFGAAHCNFMLRGAESARDENFVSEKAGEWSLPLHLKRFYTQAYAKRNGISVEMAARQLRYNWFEQLRRKYGYGYILTAHNLNDQVETVLINLTRGSSLEGLVGMHPVSGHIARPLLSIPRARIETYARRHQISWTEDSTNSETRFVRNKIRHNVVPQLEDINPSFLDTFRQNNGYLLDTLALYKKLIEEKKRQLVHRDKGRTYIDLEKLKGEEKNIRQLLYELLKDYGLDDRTDDVLASFESEPGKTFLSRDYRMVKDRTCLIVEKRLGAATKSDIILSLDGPGTAKGGGFALKCTEEPNLAGKMPDGTDSACFDADKLCFPLILRYVRPGDAFIPFGMQGKKKVSKFFKDIKLPIPDKEKTPVLCCGDHIVWVVGLRTDERFKVTPDTARTLTVSKLIK